MDIAINPLTVLAAAAAAMIVGWLWYGLIFRKIWTKIAQLDDRPAAKDAVAYPIAFVANLLTAFVLTYVATVSSVANENSLLEAALFSALFLWLGFSAARALIVTVFEARPLKLFLINTGHNLAVALTMAVVIGLIG